MAGAIGFDCFGSLFFRSPSPPIKNINYAEVSNCIVDEVHVREDISITNNATQMDKNLTASNLGDGELTNLVFE